MNVTTKYRYAPETQVPGEPVRGGEKAVCLARFRENGELSILKDVGNEKPFK